MLRYPKEWKTGWQRHGTRPGAEGKRWGDEAPREVCGDLRKMGEVAG